MIFENLLIIAAVSGGLAALLQTIGAQVYDVQQIRADKTMIRQPHARRYRRRPYISIIIPTCNDEQLIGDCLDSVLRSTYRNIEVIVVDSASADATKRIVKNHQAMHNKRKITLIARRTAADYRSVVLMASKRATGELVLVLPPTQHLQKQTFTAAIQYFNQQSDLAVLKVNVRSRSTLSLASLFQEFNQLLRYKTDKLDSVFHASSLTVEGTICTRESFRLLLRESQQALPAKYASNVIVYAPALPLHQLLIEQYWRQLAGIRACLTSASQVLRHRQPLRHGHDYWLLRGLGVLSRLLGGLVILLAPVLLGYCLYLAFRLHQPSLLILYWSALALFLVATVWDNDHLAIRQKVRYIALLPVAYVWLYLLPVVRSLAILTGLGLTAWSRSVVFAKAPPTQSH